MVTRYMSIQNFKRASPTDVKKTVKLSKVKHSHQDNHQAVKILKSDMALEWIQNKKFL